MLYIKLLGDMHLRTEAGVISGISEKGMALLAMLFMEENHQCRRYRLMETLWPDSTEEAAKYNLRYNLWQLKKNIPVDEQGENFLLITKEYCSINERYVYQCDFDQARRFQMEASAGAEEMEELLQLLSEEFFCDSYLESCSEFQEQIILWRYSLEHKRLELLRRLIDLSYAERNWTKCHSFLSLCEELDPYDETHAKMLMTIYTEAGEYEAASRYYEKFSKKLAIEIGVEPSEPLKQIAGQIQKKRQNSQKTQKGKQVLELHTAGLAQIPGYWMGDILRALLETGAFRAETYLSEVQIQDLAAVQSRLGTPPSALFMARTADAFLCCMEGMFREGIRLRIWIDHGSEPDAVSMEVVKLLQEKHQDMLLLQRK